jgi:hypothetical protein
MYPLVHSAAGFSRALHSLLLSGFNEVSHRTEAAEKLRSASLL